MRVAYILTQFPTLSETFILNEIVGLEREGIEITLFSLKRPPKGELIQPKAREWIKRTIYPPKKLSLKAFLPHLYFLFTSPANYLRLIRDVPNLDKKTVFLTACFIAKQIKEKGINHIHAHYAYYSTTGAMVISKLLGLPYSFTAHANDIYKFPKNLAEKISGAKFVITCSDYNQDYLSRRYDHSSKIIRIYHGIDLEKFEPSRFFPREGGEEKILLSVGRLREKKGFPYLVKACHILREKNCPFKLAIVGEGRARKGLEILIKSLNLQDKVLLLGEVTQEKVIKLLGQSHIFVLPSIVAIDGSRDGIPNAILEAMAMEKPVVSTFVSGIPEAVTHEVTGLLVPPKEEGVLAEALERLIQDRKLREELGKRGKEKVIKEFSLQGNVKELVKLFKDEKSGPYWH